MKNEEIKELINCSKLIVKNPKKDFKSVNGNEQNNFILAREDNKDVIFTVRLRKNLKFSENFSIMLDYNIPELDKKIKLVRYNGDHGPHRNKVIDNSSFNNGFHIHKATQEAIEAGFTAEDYAEQTKDYSTFEEALISFWKDINIQDDINQYFKDYNIKQLSIIDK